MRISGIIPARYASTRLPGKPLLDIDGISMIQRVYNQCLQSQLDDVIIATDDERIKEHVESFDANVIMTSPDHQSGTDRCNEVARDIETDVIINIQGDEPFIQPKQIDQLIDLFNKEPGTEIATLIKRTGDKNEIADPHIPKVVVDVNGFAIYFSRAPIPHSGNSEVIHYKHIGIYGYSKQALFEITQLPQSELEKTERLEQLRWIENGFKIRTVVTEFESISIDSQEDLEKAISKL